MELPTAPVAPQGPEFSVIVTCYYEEKSIEEFHARLTRTMQDLGRSFEIVLVNDGSTDGTFEKLKGIYARDPNVGAVINLFRNAGQAAAVTAGMSAARGQHFISMDSDLQLDPEDLPKLIAEHDRGADIVSGYRTNRKDPLARKLASWFANIVMRKTSGHKLSDYGCTFKIYHGRLIRAFEFGPFKEFKPVYVFARAQHCREVPVNHHPRKYGKSGWSFAKLWAYYMDHMVGISQRPFQLLSVFCLAAALLFVLRILIGTVFDIRILAQVTPGLLLNTIELNLLVTLGVLSMIGEYVIRNYITLRNYPIYVIREIIRRNP